MPDRDLWASSWIQEDDILRIALEVRFYPSGVRLVALGNEGMHEYMISCRVDERILSIPLLPIAETLTDAAIFYVLYLEGEEGAMWRVRLRGIEKIPVWQRYLNGVPMPESPRKALYACANAEGRVGIQVRTAVHGRGDPFSLIDKATVLHYRDMGDDIEIVANLVLLPNAHFDQNLSLFLRNIETEQDIEIYPDRLSRRDTKRGCVLTGRFSKVALKEKLIPVVWYIMARGTVEGKPVLLCVADISPRIYRIMNRLHRRDHRLDDEHVFLPQHNQNAVYLCYRPMSAVDTKRARLSETLALMTYRFFLLGIRKKPIILFEKKAVAAQDNGFALFEYYRNEKKADNVYYVIDESSPQAYKLEPYWDHVLRLGTYRYYVYLLSARLLVGSDGYRHVYEMFHGFGRAINRVARKKIFFLQHGVIGYKKLTSFFAWESRCFDYFTASTTLEKEIIHEYLHYPKERVPLLGLCRWDKLKRVRPEGPKAVLLFPTWRSWLESKPYEFFLESEYFKRITSLIENPALQKMLEDHGAVMNVFLHPKMENFTARLTSNAGNIRIMSGENADLSALVHECDMVITDYSSIAWDFAYQRKPVLLYQFDREKYLRETGAYIDISEPMLGPVVTEQADVLNTIERYLKRDLAIEPEFKKKIDELFDFPDEVCRATDQFIQQTALPAKILKLPQNYPRILAGEVNRRWRRLCAVNEAQEVPVGNPIKRNVARLAVKLYDTLRRSAFGGEQLDDTQD